jgi:hypothetical protein
MTTIYEIYEGRVKLLEDEFGYDLNYLPMHQKKSIFDFLRQSFIAMVEGEIRLLKRQQSEHCGKKDCLQSVCANRANQNIVLKDQISRLESELKQLKADLLPTNNNTDEK